MKGIELFRDNSLNFARQLSQIQETRGAIYSDFKTTKIEAKKGLSEAKI
jgi:hypothetical protein